MSNATGYRMAGCKILFLAANPRGTSLLALDKEIREIEAKIQASKHRDALELISKWAVRPDDLLQSFLDHRPQVVHFSGHGDANGILLMGADDQLKPVGKEALAYLFDALKDNIRLVLLNACDSRLQAALITQHIDCVVGMNKPIGDAAAIVFAASFYRAIGFGRSVREAFEQGKAALMLEGIPEEDTPELLLRPGVDAAKVVLAGGIHYRPPDNPPRVTINDLLVTSLQKTLGFIPHYIETLLRLVQSPKRFVIQGFSEGDVDLKGGLSFMALSVLLGQLLESNLVPADILSLATSMIFSFVLAVAYGAALCVAWRIVQGDAGTKKMFHVHFYFWGIVNLLMACSFMAAIGAFRAVDAALYKDFFEATKGGDLASFVGENTRRIQQSGACLPVILAVSTGLMAILLWLYASWGAYRQLNHSSKVRSVVAGFLFVMLCLPVTAIMFLIANAGVGVTE